jgi:hypothetical protein
MIAQIATASTEQSVAAQEFSQNLEIINRLGEEQAASTAVTRSLVESIASVAARLDESIGHFRIEEQHFGLSAQRSEEARTRSSLLGAARSTSATA